MGRREMHTVEYFPFFAKDGRTLYILQKKFGLAGIGFFTNLLRLLCETPDHYYCLADEYDRMRFFERIGAEEKEGEAMLEVMARTGKIDAELWHDRAVVASADFLSSLTEAYSSRTNKCITIEEVRERTVHLQINTAQEVRESGNNRGFPGISGDFMELTAGLSLKEKKIRVEKIREYTAGEKIEPDADPDQAATPQCVEDADDQSHDTYLTRSSDGSFMIPILDELFLSQQDGGRYTNPARERAALKDIIRRAMIRAPDNPPGYLKIMIEVFYQLKNGPDRFWRKQPFTPSTLSSAGIWDRVYEAAKDELQGHDTSWIEEDAG